MEDYNKVHSMGIMQQNYTNWMCSTVILCGIQLVCGINFTQFIAYVEMRTTPSRCMHLTVSATPGSYVELNWIQKCFSNVSSMALYNKDPQYGSVLSKPMVEINVEDHPDEFFRTKIKFGHPWLPGNWEYNASKTHSQRPVSGPQCFPYWIAALSSTKQLIASKCLRIQPSWMTDIRDKIKSRKIGHLMIPGTHNSGAYHGVPQILSAYVLNQDRDIWTQLVFGNRYLDLRIGYYREGFYINHGVVRIIRLKYALEQIRQFALLMPTEIIVVDLHRFPFPTNFTRFYHEQLVELLHSMLGDLAVEPKRNPHELTLDDIWIQKKNVIICYGEENVARSNRNWMWPPMRQFWANTKSVAQLKLYLTNQLHGARDQIASNPIFSIMAELTPQYVDLIIGTNNLRRLADQVNRHVTKWVRAEWFDLVNVIATDYFLGNDIIDVSICCNSLGLS